MLREALATTIMIQGPLSQGGFRYKPDVLLQFHGGAMPIIPKGTVRSKTRVGSAGLRPAIARRHHFAGRARPAVDHQSFWLETRRRNFDGVFRALRGSFFPNRHRTLYVPCPKCCRSCSFVVKMDIGQWSRFYAYLSKLWPARLYAAGALANNCQWEATRKRGRRTWHFFLHEQNPNYRMLSPSKRVPTSNMTHTDHLVSAICTSHTSSPSPMTTLFPLDPLDSGRRQ